MRRERRPAETETPAAEVTFELAENRDDGTVVLKTEDGRMFVATVAEGVDTADLIKSAKLTVEHEGLEDGVPQTPVVTAAAR